ncbi:MAG: hypothetical protein IJJ78_00165 [Paludibacteraceae bacterium]|nr:hypothetical protein [Paludibacteraceae bacterium]
MDSKRNIVKNEIQYTIWIGKNYLKSSWRIVKIVKNVVGKAIPNADILIIGKEPHNDYFVSDEEEITKRLLEQENICRSGFG